MTRAFQDFTLSFADAHCLFGYYDAELARLKPRIPEETEVLKRAALIMAVTAFETYIKDYLRQTFPPRIEAAKNPGNFQKTFDLVAKKWLRENPQNPSAFVAWTGDGWKDLITADLEQRLKALHSPKSETVIGLFDHFLGVGLAKHWAWHPYSFPLACKRLDEIIALRGHIAHVARKKGTQPTKHDVSRPDLKRHLTFLEGLVAATEKIPADRAQE